MRRVAWGRGLGAVLCAGALLGCSTPAEDPALAAQAAEAEAQGLLPWPYTPEQIREGCPEGSEIVFRKEGRDQPPVIETLRFLSTDAETATIEGSLRTLEGEAVGEPQSGVSSWVALRDHASFPVDQGSRTRVRRTVPLGEFDCWRYELQHDGQLLRYDFADGLPGPPIYYETVVDGVVILSSTMIERGVPPAP